MSGMENEASGARWGWLRGLLVYLGCYLLSPFLASILYWMLAMFFPQLLETKEHQFLYFNLTMLTQTAMAFLLVYVLILRPEKRRFRSVGFTGTTLEELLKYGLFGGLLIFAGIISCSILLSWFQPEMPPQSFEQILSGQTETGVILLLIVYAAVLAPLTEEMLFRGMLYGWLRKRLSLFPAVLTGGAIFGLVHFDIWRAIPLALGGMALCLLYEKTRSIWVTITAHGLWNFLMTIIVLAGMSASAI